MDIIKIVFKGASGLCFVDMAYEDRLSITVDSIDYEYKPHPNSRSESNVYRKWSYKTNSLLFRSGFEQIANKVMCYLHSGTVTLATDICPTEITVTFKDKHKVKASFYFPDENLHECFATIKMLVPETEEVPAFLHAQEDTDEE